MTNNQKPPSDLGTPELQPATAEANPILDEYSDLVEALLDEALSGANLEGSLIRYSRLFLHSNGRSLKPERLTAMTDKYLALSKKVYGEHNG